MNQIESKYGLRIKDHCVEHDIIDEVEEKPIAETAEIVRLKLDSEREERRLAREAEKALQDAQIRELPLSQPVLNLELFELQLPLLPEPFELLHNVQQVRYCYINDNVW